MDQVRFKLEKENFDFNWSTKTHFITRPAEDADNSFLEDLISEQTYLRLHNHLIKVMPDHWVEKISRIVTFQVQFSDSAMQ